MACRFPFTDCPGCDKCAAPVITVPINRAMTAEQRRADRWMLVIVGAVTFTVSIAVLAVAAHWGLGRVEHEFQLQSRV